jgi:hypothetical protein
MPKRSIAWSSGDHARQPERHGEQPRRLRGEVERAGVGAAHDRREAVERRIAQAVPADERVEAALAAAVRVLDVGHVVRRRAVRGGERADLRVGT